MSPSRCGSCMRHSTTPISEIPNPTPEQARKIADLDADIEALRKQRETLLHQRNALVPAVNLPPEVLATIFEFACSPVIVSEYNSRIMVAQLDYPFWRPSTVKQFNCACTTTPTLISAVCSAWRNIAMETAQLWSNTKITFNDKNSVTQAEKLRYWISKSRQRPLNLSLVGDFDEDDEDSDGWSTAVLDVLEPYAHRLETLELVVPEAWNFNRDIADGFPLLTCISLRPGDGFEGTQDFDLFAYAPKLREVRLYDCLITNVLLPWAQLERLEVTNCFDEVEECLDSLRLCPRLRSYMAGMTRMRSYDINVTPALTSMTHTALEVVEVMVGQMGNPGLLEALTLPMLRSFSIYIQSGDPLTGIPSLLPFLSRSAGKLETLCLAGQMPLEEQLLGCLEVLPQLRKLVLNNGMFKTTMLTQKTLDLMNPSKYEGADEEGASRCLAPNLETFYYRGPIETTPHALVEFLADRWHGPSAVCTSGDVVEIQPSIGLEARMARERLPSRVNAPLVRLRSVAFISLARLKRPDKPGILFDDADTAVLQRLQQEGMSIVF